MTYQFVIASVDDVFHAAYMSLEHHIPLLKNELHYAEKDKLAKWKKAAE